MIKGERKTVVIHFLFPFFFFFLFPLFFNNLFFNKISNNKDMSEQYP